MFKTVRDLYLGNIPLCERDLPSGSPLRRLGKRLARQEEALDQMLEGEAKAQLDAIVDTQLELGGVTAEENFILGFRLGVRLMAECLTDGGGLDG